MIIKLLQDGQIAAEIDLELGEMLVGSDESCKVQLEDPSVSPVHAKLYPANGQAFISDLGSEGGTMVNSAKIDTPVQLSDGDSLQIGDFIFIVQIVGADIPASEPAPQEPEKSSEGTAASSAKSMGKGLMNLAKASAREAGRGARLASLKTQMEKLKHVDLSSVFSELGAKAYELKLFADRCGVLYGEIDNLDQNIATKREGVTAADDAGFAGKAKAKALSMKGKAEAEALNLKRKSKFAEVGRIVYELNPDDEALKPLLDAVAAIKERIEILSLEYDSAAADSKGRDAFMSSAKDIGTNATSVAKSSMWRRPLVWIIAVVVIVSIYIVGAFTSDSNTQLTKQTKSSTKSRGLSESTIYNFLQGYCDAWIDLSDNPPREETMLDPVSIYCTRNPYIKVSPEGPSYGINDYEILSIQEYHDQQQKDLGFSHTYTFALRVHLRANSGATIGTKRITGKLIHSDRVNKFYISF